MIRRPPKSPLFPSPTLSRSANPRNWRDQAYRLGFHARAAWYLDGATAVLGQTPEEYWFVIVEKDPPYLVRDRKSTRLNSSHLVISYAVFCLKKKIKATYVCL